MSDLISLRCFSHESLQTVLQFPLEANTVECADRKENRPTKLRGGVGVGKKLRTNDDVSLEGCRKQQLPCTQQPGG